jgi:quinol monooxygenase YgiN
MLIVSGRLYLKTGTMTEFLASSNEAVALARKAPGCFDFVVARDPIEPDRVNVYEEWESEKALLDFRGSGADSDMSSAIVRAKVFRHVISSTGPA